MWTFEPNNNTQAGIAKPISGVFKFGATKTEVAKSKTGEFRFGTAKTSVFSNSAPQLDNKEGPIKKKGQEEKKENQK